MNELERHEAAANKSAGRAARGAQDEVEAVTDRARSSIGEATARAKESLRGARQSAESAYDDVSREARGAYRRTRNQVYGLRHYAPGSPEQARRQVTDFVQANPIMVAVVGVAAGLLAGALIPGTRREDELFGRYADDAKEEGLRYARDLVQQGRHYVEDSFEQARQATNEA